jgi:hypothetical protein
MMHCQRVLFWGCRLAIHVHEQLFVRDLTRSGGA